VYDTRSYRLRWKESTGFVDEMAASRDGQTLFVAHQPDDSGKETLSALDPTTGETRWSVKAALGDGTLAATPDGLLLWQNDTHGGPLNTPPRRAALVAFRASDGAPVRFGARVPVDSERFTLVGSHEIAVRKGSSTVILDLHTGRTVQTLAVSPGFTAASPDGLKLAVGDDSGNVRLFDLRTGESTQLNAPFTYVPGPLVFAPDGRTITAGGGNGVVLTWDVATRRATSLHGQTGNVNGVAFSGDSGTLYTDGLDGTAVVWDLATDRSLRRTFDSHDGGAPRGEPFLPYFAFSPKDDELAVVDHADHRIRFLDAKTFEVVGALPKDSSACCVPPAIDFAGDRMATVDTMGVDLWDPAARTLIRRLYTSPNQPKGDQVLVDAVAISPDGRVVAANDGSTVLLLDAGSGRVERRLDAGAYVLGLNFGAHGDLLASFNQDRSVTMWSALTGRQLWRKKISDGDLYFPDFSPDGRLYAIGTDVGLVHVFEARSGRAYRKPFVGDACFVLNVGFNPVTGVLASTGCDGTTTLADPATGQIIGSPLPGSDEGWALLAWDRSGHRLAVLDNFGAGYLWDMSEDHWKTFACSVAGRTLSHDEWRQFLPDRSYAPACAAG
jgi:WD40 repeat protein